MGERHSASPESWPDDGTRLPADGAHRRGRPSPVRQGGPSGPRLATPRPRVPRPHRAALRPRHVRFLLRGPRHPGPRSRPGPRLRPPRQDDRTHAGGIGGGGGGGPAPHGDPPPPTQFPPRPPPRPPPPPPPPPPPR